MNTESKTAGEEFLEVNCTSFRHKIDESTRSLTGLVQGVAHLPLGLGAMWFFERADSSASPAVALLAATAISAIRNRYSYPAEIQAHEIDL